MGIPQPAAQWIDAEADAVHPSGQDVSGRSGANQRRRGTPGGIVSGPASALSSNLLVRKGSARPLGLEPTERSPYDVVLAVRPTLAKARPKERLGPLVAPVLPTIRSARTVARMAGAWSALASRWGLPTILFVAGLCLVTAVAVTGPAAVSPIAATISGAPVSRPLGPTPVTWIDDGLMANPALAGR